MARAGVKIVFLLFPNLTQLDLTGPAQVLSRLPGAEIALAWKTPDPVPTDAGFSILPTATLDSISDADILCVPGGFGTVAVMEDDEVLGWLRSVAADARWVTSVCTGSLVLGAAGLLRGYRATTHWASHHQLAWFGALPTEERVVFDRNRVTGGGVTAGIVFGLALAAAEAGEEVAKLIQLSLEYDPAPPFDAGSPARAGDALVERFRRMTGRGEERESRIRSIASRLREAEEQV